MLYVAAEGEGGFAARLLALREELGDAGENFQYIAQRTTVGPPATVLADVIKAALAMDADLIVLDTLARTFGEGDENTARDMGCFVANVDQLREETRAHVAIIHHGTKEGSTPRGSGALVGAADLVVRVQRGVAGEANQATVEAAKDDADGAVHAFRLRQVNLQADADGTERRSCIAEEGDAGDKPGPRLSALQRNALQFLADLIVKEGVPLPTGPDIPSGIHGVPVDRWKEECETRRLSLSEEKKDRARVFRDTSAKLRDRGHIAMYSEWVWTTREGQTGT